MPAEVLGGVLPFAVRVVGRWLKDPGVMSRRLSVVGVGILDAEEHRMRQGSAAISSDAPTWARAVPERRMTE